MAEATNKYIVDPDYIKAGSDQTPIQELINLARNSSVSVRRHVAENPRTPFSALMRLTYDRDPEVRIGVCDNLSTPAGLLLLLSGDYCDDVRYAIAENSHAPSQILRILAMDDNPYVSERAARTLSQQDARERVYAA